MYGDAAFIQKLNSIVLENYSNEQFGVKELVEKFGMSRSQMHRKLKSAAGQSLSQFIREIRLEEALKLLKDQDLTASEVSYMVGFNSPTYFNTCFNEYFGYPPGEVKHQMELSEVTHNNLSDKPTRTQLNKWLLLGLAILSIAIFSVLVYQEYNTKKEIVSEIKTKGLTKTIAVLPFNNWSGDPSLEYVSDGITDAVITRLSAISEIDRVVPFSTVIGYKDSEKPIEQVAAELDVAYVLEGNFKLSGDRMMSNLNLIEVATNDYIWSFEYIGAWKADKIFEMQAAVAENVAENMQVNISNSEREEISNRLTKDENAYLHYLKADSEHHQFTPEGIENAVEFFKQAILIDSSFVAAYVGLGETYLSAGLIWGLMPQKEAWENAEPILYHALEKDKQQGRFHKDLIESLLTIAHFYYELNIKKAEAYYQEMVLNSSHLKYNSFFDYSRKTGRQDISMKILEGEIRANPVIGDVYWQKAIIHIMKGNNKQAIEILNTYNNLFVDNFFYLQETAKWYYYINEIEKSKENLDLMLQNFEDMPPINHWLTAIHADMEGDSLTVNSSLKELQERYHSYNSGSPAWFIALYYCHKKNYEEAFKWLNKSYEKSEVEMTWFMEEPLLQPLKNDPRYIALYNKIGFDLIEPIESNRNQ